MCLRCQDLRLIPENILVTVKYIGVEYLYTNIVFSYMFL